MGSSRLRSSTFAAPSKSDSLDDLSRFQPVRGLSRNDSTRLSGNIELPFVSRLKPIKQGAVTHKKKKRFLVLDAESLYILRSAEVRYPCPSGGNDIAYRAIGHETAHNRTASMLQSQSLRKGDFRAGYVWGDVGAGGRGYLMTQSFPDFNLRWRRTQKPLPLSGSWQSSKFATNSFSHRLEGARRATSSTVPTQQYVHLPLRPT